MEENTTPQEQEQPKQTHDELLAHIRDNLKVNDVSVLVTETFNPSHLKNLISILKEC